MTVARLSSELTVKELLDWSRYFKQIDPNTPEVVDWENPENITRIFGG